MKYRADIDGLRAIAVLSVIFYHLGFTNIFGSGFTGVDIFFVISGYLITTIIYNEIIEERFSFFNFYERRVRRIFPIFLVVILSTLCFAYYINFYDMRNFLNSLFSTLLMGGNFYFWKDTGYFDLPSHMKPLLHTWSLGVEEQFYIIFPVILIILLSKKFSLAFTLPNSKQCKLLQFIKNRFLLINLSVLWLISFIMCIVQSYFAVDTAFYLLPYRFWELLTGSILAIYGLQEKKDVNKVKSNVNPYFDKIKCCIRNKTSFNSSTKKSNILGVFGLILIFFSITLIEKINQPFPSYLALFPCVGTALCIEAGKNSESFIYKLLSFSLLKYIGKLSFSLYLWHWVVIVFVRDIALLDSADLTLEVAFLCLLISFFLSIFSYFIIEQPIRKKYILKTPKSLFISVSILTLLLTLFAIAIKKDILPQFLSKEAVYYSSINVDTAYPVLPDSPKNAPVLNSLKLVFFGDTNEIPTLLVLGDSHAHMLYSTLNTLAKNNKVAGIFICGGDGFTGIFNLSPHRRNNSNTILHAIQHDTILIKEYLAQYPIQSILISPRWTLYTNNYDRKYLADEYRMQNLTSEDSTKLALLETINFFENKCINYFMLKPIPEFSWNVAQRALNATRLYPYEDISFRKFVSTPYSSYLKLYKETSQIFERIAKEKSIKYIDLADNICDGEYCYGIAEDGTAFYYDDNHLTMEGVELFREEFLPFILAGNNSQGE